MATVLGIAGSLRRGSLNVALLRAATEHAPPALHIETGSIRDIPLYDGDLEESGGIPQPVQNLKEQLADADGLLLVTPEYNGAFPGVLKNTLDWMSRPPADIARVFQDKPVALLGATPGGLGTKMAQTAWLPVLRNLRMRPWFGGQFGLPRAREAFDGNGRLSDTTVVEQLRKFLEGYSGFVTETVSRRG